MLEHDSKREDRAESPDGMLGGAPRRVLRRLRIRARWRQRILPLWSMVFLAGALTFVLRAFRLNVSFDVFLDEVIYVKLSRSVAESLQVKVFGEAFYVHPPAFFFLEGAYVKLFAPAGDMVEQISDVRYLNVVLAGLSACVLFGLGRRLAGWSAGAAAAGIYALDPFVIKMDSRNMLETSTLLWVLLGYYVVISALGEERAPIPPWRVILAGGLFGLAVLTKDMATFLTLLPLALCFLLNWALPRWQSALAGATAILVYAVYPSIVYFAGGWSEFSYHKLRGVSRLAGLLQLTGFNQKDGPSFLEAVLFNLERFATTYALLATGAVATCFLFYWGGAARRLLVVMTASAYALLAYSIVLGTLEEQFFYFLVVPSLLATAVAVTLAFETVFTAGRRRRLLLGATIGLAIAFVGWSAYVWTQVHLTPDNGYERVLAYMDENVPRGARIASTTETSDFLLDGYAVGKWDSVEELRVNDVEYVLISSYLVEEGYGIASPELYGWVKDNGELVYGFRGRTLGLLGLYRLSDHEASETLGDGSVDAVQDDGAPETAGEAKEECKAARPECSPEELAAEVAPGASYVGGRINVDEFGRSSEVLYFTDPAMEPCEYERLEGTTGKDVRYALIIADEGSYDAQDGPDCVPDR